MHTNGHATRPPRLHPPWPIKCQRRPPQKLTKRLLGNPGSGFVRRGGAARGGRTKPRLTSKPKPEAAAEAEIEAAVEAEAECAPEVAFSWASVSVLSSRVT